MTDIVERLRPLTRQSEDYIRLPAIAAIDEIERLRAQVDGASSPGANWYHSYTVEIEKLRAQIVSLQSSLEVGKREGKKTP